MTRFFKPRRALLILLFLVVLVAGQGIALYKNSAMYWPFNDIAPFSNPPSEFTAEIQNMVVVTPTGEIDMITLDGIEHRILRRWYRNIKSRTPKEKTQEVLAKLMHFAREHSGDLEVVGVRIYDLVWDLEKGEIVKSTLVNEYLE